MSQAVGGDSMVSATPLSRDPQLDIEKPEEKPTEEVVGLLAEVSLVEEEEPATEGVQSESESSARGCSLGVRCYIKNTRRRKKE